MPESAFSTSELEALPAEQKQYLTGYFEARADKPNADKPSAEKAPVSSSETPEPATDKVPQEPAKVPASPDPEPDLDLDALPEAIRSKILKDEPLTRAEKADLVKGYKLHFQPDYTRKTQAVAEKERALEQERARLGALAAIKMDSDALDAALSVIERKRKGEPAAPPTPAEPADDFDPMTATPAEWKARDARLVEAAKQAGYEAGMKAVEEKYVAPMTRAQQTEAAYFTLAEEIGVPRENAEAVVAEMMAHYCDPESGVMRREDFTPKNVRVLAKPYLEKVKASLAASKTPVVPAPNGHSPALPKVAAPGRGGVAPAVLSKVVQDFEKGIWPESDEGRAELALHIHERESGQRRTRAELDEAMRDPMKGFRRI